MRPWRGSVRPCARLDRDRRGGFQEEMEETATARRVHGRMVPNRTAGHVVAVGKPWGFRFGWRGRERADRVEASEIRKRSREWLSSAAAQ